MNFTTPVLLGSSGGDRLPWMVALLGILLGLVIFGLISVPFVLLRRRRSLTTKRLAASRAYQSSRSAANAHWHYRRHGEQFGPVSWDELRRLIRADIFDVSDPVSEDGVTRWRAAGDVEGLFLPPPLPFRREIAAAMPEQWREKTEPHPNASLDAEQPWEMPGTAISSFRHPQSGQRNSRTTTKKSGLKEVAMIGGCFLVMFGLVCIGLMSGTSGKQASKNSSAASYSNPVRESSPVGGGAPAAPARSSLPVPADRDALGRVLEEADRLWDSAQKAEAASRYSVAMESPCLAEFKEAVLERLLPRVIEYYADEKNGAALDQVFKLSLEKGISFPAFDDPANQQHFNALKAEVVRDRLRRQFQELGIPLPQGPVTQEFIDGVNEGLAQGRSLVDTLTKVKGIPEAEQGQIDLCLKTLRDLERETAEIASVVERMRAEGVRGGPAIVNLEQRRGMSAGLRAEFRKAGVVR